MNRTLVAVSAVLALVVTACGPTAETPPPTVEVTTSAPETTVAAVDLGEAEVFEIGAAVTHPNGTQLRFERIQFFETATVVDIGLSNGSRFEIGLTQGDTQLTSGSGEVAGLLQPLEVPDFRPGEDRSLSVVFGPLSDRSAVTLEVNRGRGASPRGSTTSAPSFTVGPVVLDAATTRPVLPPPAAFDRTVVADGGATMMIDGLVFTQTRIGLSVTIENRSTQDISISPTAVPSFVVDDLGNPYFLVMPANEGFIGIPAGQARRGVLSFAGRIDPSASTLTVGVNDDRTERRYAQYPRFTFDDLPISGDRFSASASLPDPISVREEQTHPSGVTLTVGAVRFVEGATEVDVVAVNPGSESIGLAVEGTFVEDDAGAALALQPPSSNPGFRVGANSEVQATLAFRGIPDVTATEIRITFNESGSADDVATIAPSFVFGPYSLSRPEIQPEQLVASVFPVGLRSQLVSAELTVVETEIQAVASILRQFDATPVEGGFRLTLPDDILFDFGSSDLRDDALQSLSLIRDVLDYFEGDEVVVVGHTDSIGSTSSNQALSLSRAQGVVAALADQLGIDPGRLRAEGRGSAEPVAPNTNPDGSDNPDGRQLNRRVEIFVLTDRPLPQG